MENWEYTLLLESPPELKDTIENTNSCHYKTPQAALLRMLSLGTIEAFGYYSKQILENPCYEQVSLIDNSNTNPPICLTEINIHDARRDGHAAGIYLAYDTDNMTIEQLENNIGISFCDFENYDPYAKQVRIASYQYDHDLIKKQDPALKPLLQQLAHSIPEDKKWNYQLEVLTADIEQTKHFLEQYHYHDFKAALAHFVSLDITMLDFNLSEHNNRERWMEHARIKDSNNNTQLSFYSVTGNTHNEKGVTAEAGIFLHILGSIEDIEQKTGISFKAKGLEKYSPSMIKIGAYNGNFSHLAPVPGYIALKESLFTPSNVKQNKYRLVINYHSSSSSEKGEREKIRETNRPSFKSAFEFIYQIPKSEFENKKIITASIYDPEGKEMVSKYSASKTDDKQSQICIKVYQESLSPNVLKVIVPHLTPMPGASSTQFIICSQKEENVVVKKSRSQHKKKAPPGKKRKRQ